MIFSLQGERYELDQERLSVSEAMEIKRATGLTVRGFLLGLREYDVDALVALVWLAKHRSNGGSQLRIEQVVASNFDLLQDFDIEPDAEVVPTQGASPPEIRSLDGSTSSPPPSTPSTRTSTGRTGSERSRSTSGTPPPRSTP